MSSKPLPLPAFDRERTLEDQLEELPDTVRDQILGQNVADVDAGAALVEKMSAGKRDTTVGKIQLVVAGSKIDRDELEELAVAAKLTPKKSTTDHGLVWQLIEHYGTTKVRELVRKRLAPVAYDPLGSFAHYEGPSLAITKLDDIQLRNELESKFEKKLSDGKDKRRVRVKVQRSRRSQLVVEVYYERPHKTDRAIKGPTKRLTSKAFEQGAAVTFFTIKKARTGTNKTWVMMRTPRSQVAGLLRAVIGRCLWKKDKALSEQPVDGYDLSYFRKPPSTLHVVDDRVSEVRVTEIELKSQSGVRLTLKGHYGSDVLDDYNEIAAARTGVIQSGTVTGVTLRFMRADKPKQTLVTAKVGSVFLHTNANLIELVHDHLEEWEVI